MPVSTSHGGTRAKRCKHCEEGHQPSDSASLLWRIHLDQDLLDTIVSIYPSWFKDVRPPDGMATPPSSSSHLHSTGPPLSPPKAEVDESPLQKSMDKNKESLKVKLMLRRPINQLVAQGIMPPLKTPPAFHAQRRQLERAKTGDLLRAKIQARPARTELVRQHILLGGEDGVGPVDPSLAEKQRRLSKCRLADQLNDQLAHRPGPLELIKKNILHTEEPIERAVKEGVIAFRATCEGQTSRPEIPDHYMTLDDDSRSSSSPPSLCGETNHLAHSPPSLSSDVVRSTSPLALSGESGEGRGIVGSDMLETAAANAGIMTVMTMPLGGAASLLSPLSLGSTTSSLSPLSSISSPPSSSSSSLSRMQQQQQPAPGKDKNNHRKKSSKSKSSTPKTRTIKFHEYKGPPNAQKTSSGSVPGTGASSSQLSPSPVETSYELLLQQQQLLWQLEWQHKYPQIILPASQKPVASPLVQSTPTLSNSSVTSPPAPPPPPPPPLPVSTPTPSPAPEDTRPLRNLEDMKVCDLKAELKKRSLPVSGPKPQLIERLKPFTEKQQMSQSAAISIITIPSSSSSDDSLPASNVSSPAQSYAQPMSTGPQDPPSPPSPPPPTPTPPHQLQLESGESISEDIIRQQQRRIEMLQRQLITSQLQLQQRSHTFQPHQAPTSASNTSSNSHNLKTSSRSQATPPVNAKANLAAFIQQQQLNQLLAQQAATQQIILNNNNNSSTVNNNKNVSALDENSLKKTIIIGTQPATILFNHINLHKLPSSSTSSGVSTSNSQAVQSLPNFLGTFVTPSHQILLPIPTSAGTVLTTTGNINGGQGTIRLSGPNGGEEMLEDDFQLNSADMMDVMVDSKPPPPQYEVATKYLKCKQEAEEAQPEDSLSSGNALKLLTSGGGGDPQQLKVKSQLLDDIIDILIQNGDMSPSATTEHNIPPQLSSSATDKTTAPGTPQFILSAAAPDESHQIDLHSLGLDMEQFPMDLGDDVTVTSTSSHHNGGGGDVELMDVDTDWLEKFISDDPILSPPSSIPSNGGSVLSNEYDPLLSNNSSFWNELLLGNTGDTTSGGDLKMLNDQELLCGWDRIDYAS